MVVLIGLGKQTTNSPTQPTKTPYAWLKTRGQEAQDLLFPPQCIGCQAFGSILCPTCAQQPEPTGSVICQRCGRPQSKPLIRCERCQGENNHSLDLVRAATLFDHPLRSAIHSLKYDDMKELSDVLARYLFAAYQQPVWASLARQPESIVPVPMYEERQVQRGYNQAALLASSFAKLINCSLNEEWLLRTNFIRPQVGLNIQERQENVADAFQASPAAAGKAILLIDDVYTTGATLKACAVALKAAGADFVYALTIAAPHLENEGP